MLAVIPSALGDQQAPATRLSWSAQTLFARDLWGFICQFSLPTASSLPFGSASISLPGSWCPQQPSSSLRRPRTKPGLWLRWWPDCDINYNRSSNSSRLFNCRSQAFAFQRHRGSRTHKCIIRVSPYQSQICNIAHRAQSAPAVAQRLPNHSAALCPHRQSRADARPTKPRHNPASRRSCRAAGF